MPTKKELQEALSKMKKKEIAAEYNVSESTVNRWLKSHDLVRKGWGPGKLSVDKAREIRNLYAAGEYTQEQLAEMMDVCQSAINKIINNQTYKDGASFGGEADVKLGIKFT